MTSRSKQRRAGLLMRRSMSGRNPMQHHAMLVALQSSMAGFEKVSHMVDGMVSVLESEQAADDKQDAWCLSELDKADAEAKAAETDISDLDASIEAEKSAVDAATSEIEDIKAGLVELDKNVA